MARTTTLLIAGLAALALLVGVLWLAVGDPEPATGELATTPPSAAATDAAPAAPSPATLPLQPIGDEGPVAVGDPNHTTVAWPVKLRLELVEPAGLPRAAGLGTLGSGATARITGSLTGPSGEALSGVVRFVAGPNEGRALRTNSGGKFGASDLYPGLSVVEIDGPGDFDARREVRLRGGAETPVHLGFGLPGAASGRVEDREGKPVEGATVELDGQVQYSAADGSFLFASVPTGLDLVCIVSREGYAAHFELVTIAARQTNDRLVFTLLPAAALDIEIPEALGSPGEATVVLMNANSAALRTFPWRTKSPLKLAPGGRVRVDGLPSGTRVRVYAFHAGAYAKPVYAEATLQEGAPALAVVHLVPAPVIVGTVRTRDGLAAQGARVRLEAPDRVGSTLAYFEETALFLETDVLPAFPMGVQETTADHNGRFEFTSYPKQAPRRYVVATSADGSQSGSVILGPEDDQVDLVLGPAGSPGTLRIEFPGRHQAVEVECAVQGVPRDKAVIPAREAYVIEGLPEGVWRLAASWRGQEVPATEGSGGEKGFQVAGLTTQTIRLPQGAIVGQDEDTLLRAGRKP